MRRLTHEQFIERLSISNPDITAIGKYVNMHTKIECVCPVGHHWFPIAQDVIRGEGCPQCGLISRVAKRTKTHEQFVEEVYNVNPDITVVGTYKNSYTKIEFRCKEGHQWITTPDSVLSGCNCLTCANIQSSLRQRKSHEKFVEEVQILHPDITVIGKYVNANTKIEFMCSKGHVWKTTPHNILDGCSCPTCKGEKISTKKTKSHEQFANELLQVSPNITVLGEYKGTFTKIKTKCNKCGCEWESMPCNLLAGCGCPKCATSKGEKMVEEYLERHNVVFETQKRFKDCVDQRPLPFDFYLPDYNLCIEYQGAQHYIATRRMGDEEQLAYRQKHDRIKREYCKTKKINLLEIPYTKFNHISEILDDALQNIKTGGGDLCRSQNA